ncbi:hypothetical protein DER45DRAFT_84629 [Fusarium avenaceum]|nr:hypothetical protein DER45DRAFT_84629 [Fusarium avenaceum]
MEQTLLDPCKHHQAEASEAGAVPGMDVKTESQPKTRRLTIRSTPHRIASTTYTDVRLHLGSTLSEMQRACEPYCTMAAVFGREQVSIQTRFSGSLLAVEKHRGQTGSNRLQRLRPSRPRPAPKSGTHAISSASAAVLNVGRHRW